MGLPRSLTASFISMGLALLGARGGTLTITFEGLCNDSTIGSYYAGAVPDVCSGAGPDLGVQILGAVAKIQTGLGGDGNFTGEPSPRTAAFVPGITTINVANGFASPLSLYYSNPFSGTTIRVFDEANLSGNTLADYNLASTPEQGGLYGPFVKTTITFDGLGRSIGIVSRGARGVYVDDVQLNVPSEPVPEPGSAVLVSLGPVFLGICYLVRRRAYRFGSPA